MNQPFPSMKSQIVKACRYLRGRIRTTFRLALQNAEIFKQVCLVRVGRKLNRNRFTDADPIKIIYVKPRNITYKHLSLQEIESDSGIYIDSQGRHDKIRNLGRVVDGNWDSRRNEFTRHNSLYHLLIDRFEKGLKWDESMVFKDYEVKVENGERKWHGCLSKDELIRRASQVDELFMKMKKEGYVLQRISRKSTRLSDKIDEVTVNIDRHGNFIYNSSGAHRLVIALILGIDTIPVRVLLRHTQWQDVRDKFVKLKKNHDIPCHLLKYADHPDLQDILSN